MRDYIVWINECDEDYIMIELLNEGSQRALELQKEFIEKGYAVIKWFGFYIKMCKVHKEWEEE